MGKTTYAASVAAAAASSRTRTLVISTDPAPSLGDALGQRLSGSPRPVRIGSKATLFAAEIDATRALNQWLSERRAALERIALRGTWLDADDVERLLRLSLPGIDEIAALLHISTLGGSGRYDLIVIDTAPTGHTLRMLGMPETLLAVARVFDRMQAKHRIIVEALRGVWRPDEDDAVIDSMADEARALAAMLRDSKRTSMSWVTLPEPMAVEETADAAAALAAQGMHLTDVIVNRVTPPPPGPCRWCTARRAFESDVMARVRQQVQRWPGNPTVLAVAARDPEPTGLPALLALSRSLKKVPGTFPEKCQAPFSRGARHLVAEVAVGQSLSSKSRSTTRRIASKKGAWHFPGKVPGTFWMVGGKGGVGKTTCAAAGALAIAREQPGRRVLLLSTDPAHSLADALGVALGDEERSVPGAPPNLRVRELDAGAAFARVRQRYQAAVDALFDRFARGGGVDASQDRKVMQDLIDLAPPGIDELAAVIDVVDVLFDDGATREADILIMDTAPSGHALRLLEMPALVQDWAKALMAILLKYQSVTGVGDLGAVLLKLSQGLRRLRTLLADRDRTQFLLVTRAAKLPRTESTRLFVRLSRLGIHTPAAIVNAVGAGECERCARQQSASRREIAQLRDALRTHRSRPELVIAPATMPPPHGVEALQRWFTSWRALSSER